MRARTLRGVALLGVAWLLAAVAVVIATPGAEQYEISLYGAYPWYFWVLVVGALFAGALAIVGSAWTPGDRSWIVGFLIVLATNSMLLLLPLFRGYRMYGRSDPMSHLGYTRAIVESGDIAGNIYPPLHLLLLAVADATGTDPMTVALWLPLVGSLVYFVSMTYVLAFLFESRKRVLLGLPFVALPVLRGAHHGLRPFDVSVMLVPFVLYLFFKGQRSHAPPARAAFVVALVGLLLYHPLTALFLIGAFAFYLAGTYHPHVGRRFASPTNLVSLTAAASIAWYTNFLSILLRFDRVYETLFGAEEGGETKAEAYSRTVEEASPPLIDMVRVATFKYGLEFLLFGLGFAFLVVAWTIHRRTDYSLDPAAVLLAGTLVTFSLGGLVFLVADLIVPPERPFQIAKLGGVLLAGQLFYFAVERVDWVRRRTTLRTGLRTGLVALLLVLVVLSVFSLHASPLGSDPNQQVTDMEVEGSAWLAAHGHAAETYSGLEISDRRFHHARAGTRTENRYEELPLPHHFNYTYHDRLGESFADDRYLTITRKARIIYPEVFPNYRAHWRYTPGDYARLERDSTASRVYDNGDYDQYLVEGTGDGSAGAEGAGESDAAEGDPDDADADAAEDDAETDGDAPGPAEGDTTETAAAPGGEPTETESAGNEPTETESAGDESTDESAEGDAATDTTEDDAADGSDDTGGDSDDSDDDTDGNEAGSDDTGDEEAADERTEDGGTPDENTPADDAGSESSGDGTEEAGA